MRLAHASRHSAITCTPPAKNMQRWCLPAPMLSQQRDRIAAAVGQAQKRRVTKKAVRGTKKGQYVPQN
ncbi:hypothetical protein AAFF_G00286210 [Aldrovandia affinis]|uniref:Uncharacterized protein n=1 Tax=Aldrovandia affinis TaxID=143900 RepID=A0AAD7TAJ0_9TELE|nr:hypothetical protein AAFF_G00286210 [Aldrovandia affinis]